MTNREVYDAIMVEFSNVDFNDNEMVKKYVIQAVNFTKSKLNITTGMASRYVYQIVVACKNGTVQPNG
ncbi:MAG: hypothetical protein JHC33_06185 [Ignisphaera sp.]|nr:hypothetical protein [Ignisphaera sp.]